MNNVNRNDETENIISRSFFASLLGFETRHWGMSRWVGLLLILLAVTLATALFCPDGTLAAIIITLAGIHFWREYGAARTAKALKRVLAETEVGTIEVLVNGRTDGRETTRIRFTTPPDSGPGKDPETVVAEFDDSVIYVGFRRIRFENKQVRKGIVRSLIIPEKLYSETTAPGDGVEIRNRYAGVLRRAHRYGMLLPWTKEEFLSKFWDLARSIGGRKKYRVRAAFGLSISIRCIPGQRYVFRANGLGDIVPDLGKAG